jgi:hypothetical protein
MFKNSNVHNLKKGDRVKLIKVLLNPDSSYIPKEDLPVGLEGTVTHVNEGTFFNIHMKWDNGSGLSLLECDSDCYEKITPN